ncbi:MAG: histidine phosphatase family protein [Gammaproteobacteria bacterium]
MVGTADTVIDLLRHGVAAGGPRYRGSTDDPMTAAGWSQMWRAVAGRCSWDAIVTSPLARCADFARAMARLHALPLTIEHDLRELHFGEWEGCTAADLLASDAEALSRFWQDPIRHPPPGGESLSALRRRTLRAWDAVVTCYPGQQVLVVTHGGPMRVILCHAMGLALQQFLEIEVPHAAFYRLRVYPGPEVLMAPRAVERIGPRP